MEKYHKIQTIYKRESEKDGFKGCKIIPGAWVSPEIEALQGIEWIAEEKIDGMNGRLIWHGDGRLELRGKTDNANLDKATMQMFREKLNTLSQWNRMGCRFGETPATIYGEIFGGKIQGNEKAVASGKILDGYGPLDFVMFDVLRQGKWLPRHKVAEVAEYLEIKVPPIVKIGTLPELEAFVRAGFNSTWGRFPAEGIVARPLVNLFDNDGNRMIVKIKTRDFAHLKEEN